MSKEKELKPGFPKYDKESRRQRVVYLPMPESSPTIVPNDVVWHVKLASVRTETAPGRVTYNSIECPETDTAYMLVIARNLSVYNGTGTSVYRTPYVHDFWAVPGDQFRSNWTGWLIVDEYTIK